MKLTLQLQLLPSGEQTTALLQTMRQFNAAATYAAHADFNAAIVIAARAVVNRPD